MLWEHINDVFIVICAQKCMSTTIESAYVDVWNMYRWNIHRRHNTSFDLYCYGQKFKKKLWLVYPYLIRSVHSIEDEIHFSSETPLQLSFVIFDDTCLFPQK